MDKNKPNNYHQQNLNSNLESSYNFDDNYNGLNLHGHKTHAKSSKVWLYVILSVVAVVLVALGGGYLYYKQSLGPVKPENQKLQQFSVSSGDTFISLAQQLKDQGLIKNANAFKLYVKLQKTSQVKPGVYNLSQSMSAEDIINKVASGDISEFNITMKPGENIFDVENTLKKAGYSDADIKTALTSDYSKYDFLKGRPNGASLEGMIFPETYRVATDYTAKNALERGISHMQEYITANNLEQKFKAQGLSLYQGIILASVVQREAPAQDMPAVARVFLNRMAKNMTLGSDVTAAYGVKVANHNAKTVVESVTVDTPYNTRIHKGLPPTPISMPSVQALAAVANPSENNYLFFVTGDDGKTYFAETNDQHEKNTADHCDKLCKL